MYSISKICLHSFLIIGFLLGLCAFIIIIIRNNKNMENFSMIWDCNKKVGSYCNNNQDSDDYNEKCFYIWPNPGNVTTYCDSTSDTIKQCNLEIGSPCDEESYNNYCPQGGYQANITGSKSNLPKYCKNGKISSCEVKENHDCANSFNTACNSYQMNTYKNRFCNTQNKINSCLSKVGSPCDSSFNKNCGWGLQSYANTVCDNGSIKECKNVEVGSPCDENNFGQGLCFNKFCNNGNIKECKSKDTTVGEHGMLCDSPSESPCESPRTCDTTLYSICNNINKPNINYSCKNGIIYEHKY